MKDKYAICGVGAGRGSTILKYLESYCKMDIKTICAPCVSNNDFFSGNFSDYNSAVIQFGVNDIASDILAGKTSQKSAEEVVKKFNEIIAFLKNKGINNITILTVMPTSKTSGNYEQAKLK